MINTNDEYLDSNDFRKILDEYEQSVKSGRPIFMEAEELTDIAQYYSLAQEWEKAEETAEYAISIHPGAVSPIVFKARLVLLKENDPEKAEQIAETVEDKTDLDYYYIKAEILLSQKHTEDTEKYLISCMESVSEDDYNDFVLDVANLYEDYELYEKEYEWLLRAKDDTSTEYKELMARALFQTGELEESKTFFNELIDNNPYSGKYWKALSLVQSINGELSDSITSIEYAIAIDPKDEDAIRSKAEGLFKLENYEEALILFERYAELRNEDETGEMMEGLCLFNLQRYEESVIHLKKAEQIAVKSSDKANLFQIYQELAFSLNECDKKEEALLYIDKTKSLDCDHFDMEVLKGHILLSNDKLESALECFQVAIRDSKMSPDVLLHIGVSILDNRYIKKAYELFQTLFRITDIEWKKGYSHMALCCKELGKDDEFLEYLKIACDVNPEEARDVLGDMFPKEMDPKDYFYYMYNKLNPKD